MGDELRGENLVHLNVRFSTETELKAIQDMLYEKSGQGVSFTGLVEAMAHEVTIVTAIHNIKSNKGSKTAVNIFQKATANCGRWESLRYWTESYRNVCGSS
mgnify:CR=1 FL=1